ncbi:glycosyltransferase family 2 protein [Phocaeicola sp.]
MGDSNTRPLITIGIPVYNVEDYVSTALNSALSQTYPNLEIIIIDDRTPDKSMKVVEKTIAAHPRKNNVRILHHEENRGLSCARNTIIDTATGEYLFFMDSDDYITDDCIEKLYRCIEKYDVDYAEGSYDVVNQEGTKVERVYIHVENHIKDEECILNRKQFDYLYNHPHYPYIYVWNRLVRTQLLRNASLYFKSGMLYEDNYFSLSLNMKASSCYVLPDITYHYRLRDCSIMHHGIDKYSLKEVDDYCKFIEWKVQLVQQNKTKLFYDVLIREITLQSIYAAMTYLKKQKCVETEDISPFIKRMLVSPFTLGDIMKYSKHKRTYILFWIFYALPYSVQCLYLRKKGVF